jgi:hypothetical protein
VYIFSRETLTVLLYTLLRVLQYATPTHPVFMHTYVQTYLLISVRIHSKPLTIKTACNIRTCKMIQRSTLTRLGRVVCVRACVRSCVCICRNIINTTETKQRTTWPLLSLVLSFAHRHIFSQDFKMCPEPKGNLPNNCLLSRLWRIQSRTNFKQFAASSLQSIQSKK